MDDSQRNAMGGQHGQLDGNRRSETGPRGGGGGQGGGGGRGGGGRGGGGGGRGGGGGGRGGQGGGKERRGDDGGAKRQAEQSALLNGLERTRRYSGLFFGVYVLAHMLHQATAVFGPAGYDRLHAVVRSFTIDNALLEVALVWAPLVVHLASDVAFRGAGGKKGGGLRRRFSFFSGYALLVLVVLHVIFTRGSGTGPSEYAFAPLARQLAAAGALPKLFLIALSLAASVHVAAGVINVVHQARGLDRTWRDRLDWLIVGLAAALFVATVCGLLALCTWSG